MKPILKLGFTDTYENAKLFFTDILSKRYEIIRDDQNPDYLIFGDANFGNENFKYRSYKKKIFFTGESVIPTYALFDHAMTFHHENSPKHYRLPLYVPEIWAMKKDDGIDFHKVTNRLFLPENIIRRHSQVAYVQSNPHCIFRTNFVELLKEKNLLRSGGPHLNNIGGVLPRNRKLKIDFYSDCYFGIAVENGAVPGYVTEKLIDTFASLVVPIYWGSRTVSRDFNTKAFLTIPEGTTQQKEIIDYLKYLMTYDGQKEYRSILEQPVFSNEIPNACNNTDLLLDWFNTFVYEG